MSAAIRTLFSLAVFAAVAGVAVAQAPAADIEGSTADGRKVLLKADGSWRFAESAAAAASAASAPAAPVETAQAELQLLARSAIPGGCQFQLALDNQLGYEIQSLVPEFKIYRRGAVYVEQSLGFSRILPGDQQHRSLRVMGLQCADIERLQVAGGDRCVMGQLNKFSEGKGMCLARLRIKASDSPLFDKGDKAEKVESAQKP